MLIELIKATLAVIIGVASYAITEDIARGKKAKYSARIISMDMYNAISIINNNKQNGPGFPFYKLTLLHDWRREFYNVHEKLSTTEATMLMEYYRTIEHMEVLRSKLEEYNEALQNGINISEFKAKQMLDHREGFEALSEQLFEQDYKDLIDKLQGIS